MLRVCLLAGLVALTGAPVSAQPPTPSLREQAETGDVEAAYAYGYSLSFPEEGEPDTVTSLYWLARAADQDYPPANYMLGVLYRDGFGVDPDIDRARAFFELAWQAGDPVAGHDLAELMLYDYDNEREEAVTLLESLLSDPEIGPLARLTLAETLMFDSEAEEDAIRAVMLAGDVLTQQPDLVRAHYLIGIGAAEGINGSVDRDAARQAWEAGTYMSDGLATTALADSWLDPDWGEPNPVEALALYRLAAEMGDDTAADAADALATSIGPAALEEADARQSAWMARMGWELIAE
jgi:TPR repeat protein